jgi:hypothetical protein
VCVPPQLDGFNFLTIGVSGDNSSTYNCQIQPCFDGDCTCRNIFAYAACGTLSSSLKVAIINSRSINHTWAPVGNHQHVAWWLSKMGLTSVQTLSNDLTISIDASYCGTGACNEAFSWAINIFPQLEVVQGTLGFRLWTTSRLTFALLPGSGFAKLRARGRTTFTTNNGGWANADLSFLSSLVCPGTQIDGNALSTLGSLTGLDRVVDGSSALDNQSCLFSFNSSQSNLSNVSAITPFAGCGGRQRRDNSTFLPCLKVWCGQINTRSGLCNYVASGNKCSPPSSPPVPRPPPSPPSPPSRPPPSPPPPKPPPPPPQLPPPVCSVPRELLAYICGS